MRDFSLRTNSIKILLPEHPDEHDPEAQLQAAVPQSRSEESGQHRFELHLPARYISVHQRNHHVILEPCVHGCIPAGNGLIPILLSFDRPNAYIPDRVEVLGLDDFVICIFLGRSVALPTRDEISLHGRHTNEHDSSFDVHRGDDVAEAVWERARRPFFRQKVLVFYIRCHDKQAHSTKQRVRKSVERWPP